MEVDDLPKSDWLLTASTTRTAEHHTMHATCECTWEWPEVIWRCSVHLSLADLKAPLCVAFFCLQTAGLTWSFLNQRSKCRGYWQQPTPPAVHLHFSQFALWQLLAAHHLGAGNGPLKNWKVSLFSESGEFYPFSNKLFQSYLPPNQDAVCSQGMV